PLPQGTAARLRRQSQPPDRNGRGRRLPSDARYAGRREQCRRPRGARFGEGPVNEHSTYEALRHFADSWGWLAMVIAFVIFVTWPFRPGARDRNRDAAQAIFKDDFDGQ